MVLGRAAVITHASRSDYVAWRRWKEQQQDKQREHQQQENNDPPAEQTIDRPKGRGSHYALKVGQLMNALDINQKEHEDILVRIYPTKL